MSDSSTDTDSALPGETRPGTEPRPSAVNGADAEFALGGQAVLEGVMMRSPNHYAVAVRRESGEILVHAEEAVSFVKRKPALNKPFIRGVFALFESLLLGMRALNYSANVAMEDSLEQEASAEGETKSAAMSPRAWLWVGIVAAALALVVKIARRRSPELFTAAHVQAVLGSVWSGHSRKIIGIVAAVVLFLVAERLLDAFLRRRQQEQGIESAMPPGAMAVTIGLSFALGIGLFVLLPNAAADWFKRFTESHLLLNLYEGLLRLLIFVAYVSVIGLLPDIRRVFQYHGAEHKVVWTHEHKLPLTVENARQFSTAHPRCGTSFVLFVLVLSILVFAFLGWPAWPVRIASRLLLLPLLAGVSYEILKLTAKKQHAALASLLISPGLLLQRLTTHEPDDEQLEVALRAMEAVIERETAFLATPAAPASA